MFFYISKLLWFLLQPSNAVLLLLLLGILMLWSRRARAGRWIVLTAGLALLVGGLSPLGHALLLPLENRFSRGALDAGERVTGILILGGAQDMSITVSRRTVALNEAGERIVEAVLLAKRFPEAKVVFTGGSGAIFGEKISEAEGARLLLTGLGISQDRLVLENRAKNTFQNAQFNKKLIKPGKQERWLLVTSASHMPRAMGSFRSVGFKVEPWPVDYRTRGTGDVYRFYACGSCSAG